jgi:hypothetical protein
MDGVHVEGMPADAGHALLCPQLGPPGPGEETVDRDDPLVTVRGKDRKKGLRGCLELLGPHDVPLLRPDADGHRPGVEIAPTIRLGLFRGAWHEVSSS